LASASQLEFIRAGRSRIPRIGLEYKHVGGPVTAISRSRASISSQRIEQTVAATCPARRWPGHWHRSVEVIVSKARVPHVLRSRFVFCLRRRPWDEC